MTEPVHRVEIQLSPPLLARVERWRGRQMPIPPRAAALRALVLAGLAAGEEQAVDDAPTRVNVGAADVPPFPTGNPPGTKDLNVTIPTIAYLQVEWFGLASGGLTKKASIAELIRDGALRLAHKLHVAPAGDAATEDAPPAPPG